MNALVRLLRGKHVKRIEFSVNRSLPEPGWQVVLEGQLPDKVKFRCSEHVNEETLSELGFELAVNKMLRDYRSGVKEDGFIP